MSLSFLASFVALTFVKVFHWLVADRLDFMAVAHAVSRLQHARMTSFMGILLVRCMPV